MITEDGFLQLIAEKSSAGQTKEKENKTPSPEVKREKPKDEAKKEATPSKAKEAAVKKEVKMEKPKPKTPLEEAIGFQIPKIPIPAETTVSFVDISQSFISSNRVTSTPLSGETFFSQNNKKVIPKKYSVKVFTENTASPVNK